MGVVSIAVMDHLLGPTYACSAHRLPSACSVQSENVSFHRLWRSSVSLNWQWLPSSSRGSVPLLRANAAPLNNSAGSFHLKANGVKVDAVNGLKVDGALGNSALRATASKEDKELLITTERRGNGSAIAKILEATDSTGKEAAAMLAKTKLQDGAEIGSSSKEGAGLLSGLKSKIGKLDVEVLNTIRQGRLVENKVVYRQTFVIRSYEVGADKTVSIDTFNNLFQDVALNHVWVSGLAGDGFGATHAMIRNHLIWVVTRMHVQVDRYPTWGDVIEIDSWVGGSGKNGMRRDWLVRDHTTGQILARATSTWVMMNKVTRRLSKMPDDVRAEISPWFIDRTAMTVEDAPQVKIAKLDGSAAYIRSNLTPKRSDLDMNQHVNNVKYIGWMMESLPAEMLESNELGTIILEYRKECGQHDTVQTLTSPEATPLSMVEGDELGACSFRDPADNSAAVNGCAGPFSYTAAGHNSCGFSEPSALGPIRYTHLIRMENDSSEILRGRSIWRSKQQHGGASDPPSS